MSNEMSNEMYFCRDLDTFGITYSENTLPSGSTIENDTSTIFVASPTLTILIDVIVNDDHLQDEGALNLLQRQLESSAVWRALMFSFTEKDGTKTSVTSRGDLRLALRCDLFHPKLPDFAHAEFVRYLQLLAIKFEYWSPHQSIHYEDLFDTLQYSLTSLLINLEFKYPFIFSFYGKQLVKINYKSLIHNSTLLATPLDNSAVPDHRAILAVVLRKLQSAIRYEFNTLNVMKECESRKWQARSCRKYQGLLEVVESRKSIKSMGVDLRVLREQL